MSEKKSIEIETKINSPVEKVWEFYTKPEHIINWNFASKDWHTPRAENDLRVGGKFSSRMESKDGSMGFDFTGTYDKVEINKIIEYTMDDNRKVKINFIPEAEKTRLKIEFEAESENPLEMQRQGWQSILNNFKSYVEKS